MGLKLRLYVGAVIIGWLLMLVRLGWPASRAEIVAMMLFALLGMLLENYSIELPLGKATFSVSAVPVGVAALLLGARGGAWVGLFGGLNLKELRGGKPLYRNIFNAAQVSITAAAAGYLFAALGGDLGRLSLLTIVALIGALLISYLINALLTGMAIALANRLSLWQVLRSLLAWGGLSAYLTTTPLVLLMALSYLHIGYLGVILFLLPLFLTRIVFKLYRDTRQNYVETVQALAQAIDAKDAYTRGHAERVAVYAVEIARRLKWRGDRLEQLYFVGLLHDIGKMGVRDAILTKNGPLTPEEREEINNHPQIGAEIVAKISFLKEEAAYIRHHHEHYNGRGYPGKIEREVIPLGARIIAVADAFDAMTTIRSYQPARTVAEALFELRHCSHSQFDPLVVEAMAGFIRENPDVVVFAQEAAATGYSYLARTTGQ